MCCLCNYINITWENFSLLCSLVVNYTSLWLSGLFSTAALYCIIIIFDPKEYVLWLKRPLFTGYGSDASRRMCLCPSFRVLASDFCWLWTGPLFSGLPRSCFDASWASLSLTYRLCTEPVQLSAPVNRVIWLGLMKPSTFTLTFRRLMSTIVAYRTANLQSCILYIYSTNIGTEYFKHGIYSPFFFSSKCSLFHNSNVFDSCVIHILYTGCAKIKKIIPAPKG